MNIQILNLHDTVQNEDLKSLFETHGEVSYYEVAMDLFTDKSRGFGHVEMPNDDEALKAIKDLDQSTFHKNTISVKAAPPREIRSGSYKIGSGGTVNPYRFKKN